MTQQMPLQHAGEQGAWRVSIDEVTAWPVVPLPLMADQTWNPPSVHARLPQSKQTFRTSPDFTSSLHLISPIPLGFLSVYVCDCVRPLFVSAHLHVQLGLGMYTPGRWWFLIHLPSPPIKPQSNIATGWWLNQPYEQYACQPRAIWKYIWENNKGLKPPTSSYLWLLLTWVLTP